MEASENDVLGFRLLRMHELLCWKYERFVPASRLERGDLRADIDVTNVIQIVGVSYFYTFFLMTSPLSIDDWLAKVKPIIMQGVAPGHG